MTVVPPKEGNIPRRGDRLYEAPTGKNAQGMFLPSACIFVGNLSTKVPADRLATDLKNLFSQFGTCHPKIKQGKKKDLPGAFVQFERAEDADAVLACEKGFVLHGRGLRVERIKGKRTAILGLRSGGSIAPSEVDLALGGRGPLESRSMEKELLRSHNWADVCKVTFVYVDDCRDAIKFFSKNEIFFLKMVDSDASPTSPNQRHTNGRERPPTAPVSSRNGNSQGRWSGSRPQRGGPANNGGGYRAYPKFRPPHFAHENIPPFQNPPFMANGMPYSENHLPFYPPHPVPAHLPPFSNAGYGTPPFVMDGFPAYTGAPFIPSQPAYAPVSGAPFIINHQPGYNPYTPPYYGEQFHQDHGYFGPHPNMNFHYGGRFPPTHSTPAYHGESFPQNPNPPCFTPPEIVNQPTPPSTESSTVKGTETNKSTGDRNEPSKSPELELPQTQAEEPKTEESPVEEAKVKEPKTQEPTDEVDIFNLPESEKPTRLIRVESEAESDDHDEEKEKKPLLRRRSDSNRSAQAPSLETVMEEAEEDEMEDQTTLEPASGSDTDSASENKPRKAKRTRVMRCGPFRERASSSDSSPSGSRGRSRTRKPLAAEYQPTTGRSVEDYIRSVAETKSWRLPESQIQEVIREMEDELLKRRLAEKYLDPESSGHSRSGSAGSGASTDSWQSF